MPSKTIGEKANNFLNLADEVLGGQAPYKHSNEPLSEDGLHDLLHKKAVLERADTLAKFVGNTSREHNKKILKTAFRRLGVDRDGNKVSAKEFEKELFAKSGEVFTGHPVSSMNLEMAEKLSRSASVRADPEKSVSDIQFADEALLAVMEEPFIKPTLNTESAASIKAILSSHDANEIAVEAAIEVGQELYPDEWTSINYMPEDFATWIPFDWDGRDDVEWQQLMEKRIELQVLMLDRYAKRIQALETIIENPDDKKTITDLKDRVIDTKEKMAAHQVFFADYKNENDPDGSKLETQYALLTSETQGRITDAAEITGPLNDVLNNTNDKAVQQKLVHLRSDVINHGLSIAKIHFRLNAKSLITAIGERGLEVTPDKTAAEADTAYFDQLSKMVAEVEPKKPNLHDVRTTSETVLQQMIMISEFDTHIESGLDVRFLIAETENAIVPLSALYFAKLLGVEDKINISGLCENKEGQDNFRPSTELLMTEQSYVHHVGSPRANHPFGMAVDAQQRGFSDGTRLLGAIASAAHMDRGGGQHILVTAERIEAMPTMTGSAEDSVSCQLTVFGTGGQSDGRGYHWGSPASDTQYKNSGHALHLAREKGIKIKAEKSFQGMDGCALLLDPDMALAYLAQKIDYLTDFDLHEKLSQDPYYQSDAQRPDAFGFFKTVRDTHGDFISQTGYATLVEQFAKSAPSTGSRPAKRVKAKGAEDNRAEIGNTRAIVHTGTLKRLGLTDTILHGVGAAIKEDPDRFDRLCESDVFKDNYIFMIQKAVKDAMPGLMRAQVELYNPQFWLDRAKSQSDQEGHERCRNVAKHMERIGVYQTMSPIVTAMEENYLFVKRKLQEKGLLLQRDPKKIYNEQTVHGHRMANTIQLFEKAMEIPKIPGHHGLTREDAISRLFQFDQTVIPQLKEIYRETPKTAEAGEVSEFAQAVSGGYRHYNHEVFDPLDGHLDKINNRGGHVLIQQHCTVG